MSKAGGKRFSCNHLTRHHLNTENYHSNNTDADQSTKRQTLIAVATSPVTRMKHTITTYDAATD